MHLSIKSFSASVNQLQSIFLKFLNFLNVKCKFTECYNFSSKMEIKGLKLPRKRPSAKQKSLYFVTFNHRLQGIKVYSVNTKSISCMNFQTKLLERFFFFFLKQPPVSLQPHTAQTGVKQVAKPPHVLDFRSRHRTITPPYFWYLCVRSNKLLSPK